jgi:uridine kinase
MKNCIVIGIAGGSGSGKTTLARELHQRMGEENSCVLLQDSYYLDQSDKFDHDGGSINFDHPDALEFELLAKQVQELKKGNAVNIPVYEFSSHKRLEVNYPQAPKKVIIVEGILIFHHDYCCQLFDQMIFVDTPETVRFQRRLKRDVEERGRTEQGVHDQFFKQVKPMHDTFVEQTKMKAHHLISGEQSYDPIIEEIINYCKI